MAVVKARAKIAGEDRRVSVASDLLVPMHIRELSSGIFDVIRAYYKWADLPGNFQSDAKRLLEYTDRNISTDDYVSFIKDMFMRQFPNQSASEIRHLLQFANDFYAKRGTADAYKFLFKALYNDDVELFYPSKYLFKSSDGVWVKNTILKCLGTDQDIVNVVGRRLWGVESGASAVIKKVIFYAAGSDLVAEMTVSGVKGEFVIDEILETRDAQPQIKSRIFAQIGSYAINNPGRGYRAGAILPSVGGDGTGLSATIGEVDDRGVILTINIVSSGIGYVYSIPTVNMNDPNLFDGDLPVEDRIVADITFDNSTAYTTPGEFETLRSAPSNIFKLHDGEYYQDFSYVLKTNVPLATFEAPVLALLHPAGTSMFAQPNIVSDGSSALNNTGSILYQYSKPDGVNYNNSEANSGRKYFDVEVNLKNPHIQINADHTSYMVLGIYFNSYAYRSLNIRSFGHMASLINKTIQYTPRKETSYKTLTIANSTPYNVDADLLLSNKNLFVDKQVSTVDLTYETFYTLGVLNVNSDKAVLHSQSYNVIISKNYTMPSKASIDTMLYTIGTSSKTNKLVANHLNDRFDVITWTSCNSLGTRDYTHFKSYEINKSLLSKASHDSNFFNVYIGNKFKTVSVTSEEARNYVINKSIDYQVDVANFTELDKIGNSSKFLWEIGAKKMDELGDLSTMYGLSPTVAYSNITLSP